MCRYVVNCGFWGAYTRREEEEEDEESKQTQEAAIGDREEERERKVKDFWESEGEPSGRCRFGFDILMGPTKSNEHDLT